MPATHIDFYLDFMSPFGYLARDRLLGIADRYGATVTLHPVDIPFLKRAAGNTGPSNRQIPPKIVYLTEDLQRWARRYGLQMVRDLPGPDTARFNTGLLLARDLNRERDYVKHAWDCVWRDGLDPGLDSSVAELVSRMNWRLEDFLAFVESDAAKARYQESNESAAKRGVFGVPIFTVGDQMWWGNDRLFFLEEYLSGHSSAAAE
jgi:2-hydroxychromene-2-carboxylate isomerase